MRLLFLLGTLAFVLAAQVPVAVSDTAFVTRPTQSITLEVRVVANQEVLFVAPQNNAVGTFPDAPTNEKSFIRVRATAAGVAQARFLTNTTQGWNLIEASIPGALPAVTFAVSNLTAPPTTASTPAALRTAIAQTFLATGAETPTTRLHGPFLLTANTLISTAAKLTGFDDRYPYSQNAPLWFFWIDDQANAAFEHPVRFGRLSVTAAIGNLRAATLIVPQTWWPTLTTANGAGFSLIRSGASNQTHARPLKNAPAASSPFAAAEDACILAVRGPDVIEASAGLNAAIDALVDAGLVPAGNVYTRSLTDGDGNRVIRAMRRIDLQLQIDAMLRKPCRKIYFLFDGHGYSATGPGGLALAPDEGTPDLDNFTYSDLAAEFAKFENAEFCIIISACFSGQAASAFNGLGLNGQVLTVAAADRFGYQATMNRDIAPALASGNGTLAAALAGILSSNSVEVRTAGAAVTPIDPSGNRLLQIPFVALPDPGTTTASIPRPGTSRSDRPFNFFINTTNTAIGDYTPNRFTMPGGQTSITTPVAGRTPGLTTLRAVGDWDRAGSRILYAGNSSIQVSSFNVTPGECVLGVGGTCTVFLERYFPVAELDNGAEYELTFADSQGIATVAPTELTLPKGLSTTNFVITAARAGFTFLTVRNRKTRLFLEVRVRVFDRVPPNDTPGTSCAGGRNFLVSTTRTNQQHTCCVGESQNEPIEVTINPDGTVRVTSRGLSFPQTMTGTADLTRCSFTARGNISIPPFLTEATLNSVIGDSTRPFATPFASGNREAPFDSIRFDYRVGTNGTLPGGQPATFEGTGRIQLPTGCTYSTGTLNENPTATGGLFAFSLTTGANCAWTASTANAFIRLVRTTGSGPTSIGFALEPNNTNVPRAGSVTVAGRTVSFTQPALAAGAPLITGIANGASFGPFITSGSWVTITGTSLATATRIWRDADFNGQNLPTRLDDTSVTFNGIPGLVYFISPTQINALAPDGLTGDTAIVVVRRGTIESNAFTVTTTGHAPAFFQLGAQTGNFIAAVHADGVLAAKPGTFPGLNTRSAKPGEVLLLFTTGLGPTEPATPAARIVAAPAGLAARSRVLIGGTPATILFAGKVSSGLYQLNILIPEITPADWPIEIAIDGRRSQASALLTVDPR